MLHQFHEFKSQIMFLRPASAMPCKLLHFILPQDHFSRQSQRSVHHPLQWVERPSTRSSHLTTSLRSTYISSTASMQMQLQNLRTETRTAVMVANIRLLQAIQTAPGNRLQQERATRRANPTLPPRGRMLPRLVVGNLCLPMKPIEKGDDRTQFATNLDDWILGSNSRLPYGFA
jgi:hypothetical protein